jgi:predicted TIM-barrel fold metal-dependent hydrolase
MTKRPERIVDAHVHLWDPARTDWYPYLSGRMEIGMGNVTGMSRLFNPEIYQNEADGWNVVALVNVAAATGRNSVDETLYLDAQSETLGHPAAIIGGLPPTDSSAEAIALLDIQMKAKRFKGLRPMGQNAPPLPDDDVLTAMTERGLIFELMAHPPQLVALAHRLEAHPQLNVVVEHTGWPRSADNDERVLWETGIAALADVGPNVSCKISGLAMPLGAMSASVFAPWVEKAIEAFGAERCMFASNFPVDGMHGSLNELWTAFSELTSSLDPKERDLLFAGVAERVYSFVAQL